MELMDSTLLDRFFKIPDAAKIRNCIQCGTCSASCPLMERMDMAPRKVFALIRDGFAREALSANTPWFCVSCYNCMVRCPQEIPVTDIMYGIKQLATAEGLAPPNHKLPDLYAAFADNAEANGRITETMVMAGYGRKHPLDAVANIPLAARLLRRGRLDFTSKKSPAPSKVRELLSAVKNRRQAP